MTSSPTIGRNRLLPGFDNRESEVDLVARRIIIGGEEKPAELYARVFGGAAVPGGEVYFAAWLLENYGDDHGLPNAGTAIELPSSLEDIHGVGKTASRPVLDAARKLVSAKGTFTSLSEIRAHSKSQNAGLTDGRMSGMAAPRAGARQGRVGTARAKLSVPTAGTTAVTELGSERRAKLAAALAQQVAKELCAPKVRRDMDRLHGEIVTALLEGAAGAAIDFGVSTGLGKVAERLAWRERSAALSTVLARRDELAAVLEHAQGATADSAALMRNETELLIDDLLDALVRGGTPIDVDAAAELPVEALQSLLQGPGAELLATAAGTAGLPALDGKTLDGALSRGAAKLPKDARLPPHNLESLRNVIAGSADHIVGLFGRLGSGGVYAAFRDDAGHMLLDPSLTLDAFARAKPSAVRAAIGETLAAHGTDTEGAADALTDGLLHAVGNKIVLDVYTEATAILDQQIVSHEKWLGPEKIRLLADTLSAATGEPRRALFAALGLPPGFEPTPEALGEGLSTRLDAMRDTRARLGAIADLTKGAEQILELGGFAFPAVAARHGIRLDSDGEIAVGDDQRNFMEAGLATHVDFGRTLKAVYGAIASFVEGILPGVGTADFGKLTFLCEAGKDVLQQAGLALLDYAAARAAQ